MDNNERYINPYTDFGFKKLFGTEMNKDLLISFLNALFHGEKSEISEDRLFDAMALILDAYEIGPNPPEKKPAILGVIT